METFASIVSQLWSIWAEMLEAVWSILPKAISFLFWVLSAIVILPCVFVAGQLYPKWVEWGEDL
ncbi:hypothetical protein KGQ27_00910 [Patescibacteria group bacterium]|nr:hypothetical protein [Patescibacteria group bacterium]MDE1946595.1 hypothetical protein [Patescibacteria group bacterium]MDE2010842.1 hypothetical protein [Patescibacteria group bacterium]MDE2233222.1 hypothetical protein [Patescibacteria group bacterium]